MSVKVQSALVPPSMTTTQRDAIPAGRRPPGSLIFNTTTKRVEVNYGTDASPAWSSIGGAELAYVQNATNLTITTANWPGQLILQSPVLTFDGVTTVMIQFYAPAVAPGGTYLNTQIIEDSLTLVETTQRAVGVSHGIVRRTPSAGSHTYYCRSVDQASNGTLLGASYGPFFLRITQV
jgi:hypothetical protein